MGLFSRRPVRPSPMQVTAATYAINPPYQAPPPAYSQPLLQYPQAPRHQEHTDTGTYLDDVVLAQNLDEVELPAGQDAIIEQVSNIMARIDEQRHDDNEEDHTVIVTQESNGISSQLYSNTRTGTHHAQTLDRRLPGQIRQQRVTIETKVSFYVNSRLPANLPLLRVYIPTWPLICLAAQYSANVYNSPSSPQEQEAFVSADAGLGKKAMVIKSVPCDDKRILVFAIRGTNMFSWKDWNINRNTAPVSPAGFLDDEGNLCHAGFLRVAKAMTRPIAMRLRSLLQENPTRASCSLVITGHSAGGAVAALLYSHMLSAVESELSNLTGCFKRVHCITFGAPPVSLLPLNKPQDRKYQKSLFFSFMNEGDPIVRAEVSYFKSLANLLYSPLPSVRPTARVAGKSTAAYIHESMSNIDLSLSKLNLSNSQALISSNTLNTKKHARWNLSQAILPVSKPIGLFNSTTTPSSGPFWRLPTATLSNSGRLILLRVPHQEVQKRRGQQIQRSTSIRWERDNLSKVSAHTVTDEQLRGVIFGDPSFPYPENVALSSHLESLIRTNGGVPATIGFLDGIAHVGMSPDQITRLVSTAGSVDTWKISRRDIGLIAGLGMRGRKLHGGTTISGTMILAHLAGIKIFATGGLGGVHRGGENTMDISADLTELGRTPVAIVSSGCKSFLDLERTLEYLETQGVGVATFADGRQGDVDFPAFFSRDSGVKSPQTIQTEADAAAIVYAQFRLGVNSGLLFANPVPEDVAMTKEELNGIIKKAVQEADERGIKGAKNTPFVLKRIRELSNGSSVTANRGLIEANVIRGTKVAVELAKLEKADASQSAHGFIEALKPETSWEVSRVARNDTSVPPPPPPATDLLVIGSLAADTSCNYEPLEGSSEKMQPILRTSNPGVISQSVGGVGRNVATAAQYGGIQVSLASAVADDLAGGLLKDRIAADSIDTSPIRTLSTSVGARTAQYIAINDANKDLVMAMGDFSIFTRPEFEEQEYWSTLISSRNPKWVVVDGNWTGSITTSILAAAKQANVPAAFEPVSTAKAARVFTSKTAAVTGDSILPNHLISLATPNKLELAAMHAAAQDNGLFESDSWWQCINQLSLPPSGSRDRFTALSSPSIVDSGVPQQAIRLLPFIPNLLTKIGSDGCLLMSILRRGDSRLSSPQSAKHILSRNLDNDEGPIGGVYMRLFPPAEIVEQDQIVSVNGVGDTLLGMLMAKMIQEIKAGREPRLEEIIPVAQKAAVMTLKSSESVSPHIKELGKT